MPQIHQESSRSQSSGKEVMKPTLFHLVKQTLNALILLSSSMRNTCVDLEKLGRQMVIHDLIKEFEKDNAGKKATDSKRKASSAASSAADKKKRGE